MHYTSYGACERETRSHLRFEGKKIQSAHHTT